MFRSFKIRGLELMLQLLRVKQPKTILEIGSAIGYSSLMKAAPFTTESCCDD